MIEARTVEIDGRYAPAVIVYDKVFIPPDTVALFRRQEDCIAHAIAIARTLNKISWRQVNDFIHNMGWVQHGEDQCRTNTMDKGMS